MSHPHPEAVAEDAADMNFEKRVEQFVKLRDVIAQLDDAHKKKMAPYRETLELLSSALLRHLIAISADSVRSAAGTVYRTERKSATIADKSIFWDYVMTTKNFDLIDYKANVTAVAEHIKEKEALPPGVNYSAISTVGVRRA